MIPEVSGVSYGSFIVPGLLMLTLLTQSISNSAFGIFFPKYTGSMYEILAAPISPLEIIDPMPIIDKNKPSKEFAEKFFDKDFDLKKINDLEFFLNNSGSFNNFIFENSD